MPDKHLSSQFDADLNLVSRRLLEMGGLVEQQIARAMQALDTFDLDIVEQVISDEHRLNTMEVQIDEELSNIIARRQPAAKDLRLLMAASKTITNLERAGDEARKIAKRTRRIAEDGAARTINIAEIKLSGEMATHILRRSLDAFARLDTVAAAQIVRDDRAIDEQFRGFVRKLVTYMMEDPGASPLGSTIYSSPRPSSVLATMRRTSLNSLFMSSKVRTCATCHTKNSSAVRWIPRTNGQPLCKSAC